MIIIRLYGNDYEVEFERVDTDLVELTAVRFEGASVLHLIDDELRENLTARIFEDLRGDEADRQMSFWEE